MCQNGRKRKKFSLWDSRESTAWKQKAGHTNREMETKGGRTNREKERDGMMNRQKHGLKDDHWSLTLHGNWEHLHTKERERDCGGFHGVSSFYGIVDRYIIPICIRHGCLVKNIFSHAIIMSWLVCRDLAFGRPLGNFLISESAAIKISLLTHHKRWT